MQKIAEKLYEKGIDVKSPTLSKYLNESRRKKGQKKDTPQPPPSLPKNTALAPKPDRPATVSVEWFVITPDTLLDER